MGGRIGWARWSVAVLVLAALATASVRSTAADDGPTADSEQFEPARPGIVQRLETARAALRGVDAAWSDAEARREARTRLRNLVDLLEAQRALAAAETDAEVATGADDSSSVADAVSVERLNALLDSRERLERRLAASEATLEMRRGALDDARAAFDEAERVRRRAKLDLEQAGPAERAAATTRHRLEVLRSRVAQETVALRRLELERALADESSMAAVAALDARIEALRERLAQAPARTEREAADPRDLERMAALRRAREEAERRLASLSVRVAAERDRYSRAPTPDPTLLAELELMMARQGALEDEIESLSAELEQIEAGTAIWQTWHAVLRGDRERAASFEADAAERIAALRQSEAQILATTTALGDRLSQVEARLADPATPPRIRDDLAEHAKDLSRLQASRRSRSEALAAERRLRERVLADARRATGHVDLASELRRGAESVRRLWSFELASVDDAPITVGSLVLAVVLLALGSWISRRAARSVRSVAERRFKLDPGAANALQTLSFYLLIVGFGLLALRAIHFPLTAFTVLGGALAIGVGFGSQNVMNNFISGLILMLERPVRAHDVVEIDGNHGTIERIGARSTQIRATDGRHIVVPNSFFLESNVVNWTLSDDLIRTRVAVGVAYGSPTRLVEELIERVVREESEILDEPKPILLFGDFGDNALVFEVYFWVTARGPMALRRVESRVRFRIDDFFRENDIVIAFPQRDVHFDSAHPIEVRVRQGEED